MWKMRKYEDTRPSTSSKSDLYQIAIPVRLTGQCILYSSTSSDIDKKENQSNDHRYSNTYKYRYQWKGIHRSTFPNDNALDNKTK